ncbi:hypothetical protein ACFS07_06645 [Undibacterium arcticum]
MNNNYADAERGAQQLDALFEGHDTALDHMAMVLEDMTPLPELPDHMIDETGAPAAIDWPQAKPIQSELLPVLPFTASLLPKKPCRLRLG